MSSSLARHGDGVAESVVLVWERVGDAAARLHVVIAADAQLPGQSDPCSAYMSRLTLYGQCDSCKYCTCTAIVTHHVGQKQPGVT